MSRRFALSVFSCLLAFASVVLPGGTAIAQPQATMRTEPRWNIEIFGARGSLAPDDLNATSLANETTYGDRFAAYATYLRLNGSSATSGKTGSFPLIENAPGAGLRLGRRMGRRVTLVANVDFLDTTREGSPQRNLTYTTVNPLDVRYTMSEDETVSFSPVKLAVRRIGASVGARVVVLGGPRWSLEALALGGVGWARVRQEEEGTDTTSYYKFLDRWKDEMTGTGVAPTGELGGRFSARLGARTWAFVEGSYQWERFAKISGTSSSDYATQNGDAGSPDRRQTTTASGQWVLSRSQISTGYFNATALWPVIATSSNTQPFRLQLAGARLRVGLSYRFNLW